MMMVRFHRPDLYAIFSVEERRETMTLRSISLVSTDLHDDILEIRANNKKPFANEKNVRRAIWNVKNAVEREGIEYGKVRRRGNTIYLVLSESAEANLPKRSNGFGQKKRQSKLLTKKIVRAKVGA
jgi:hypothetical protein